MFLLKITNDKVDLKDNMESFHLSNAKALTWLHFEDEMDEACQWLNSQENLDSYCADALCHQQTRPRLFFGSNQEVVILLRIPCFDDHRCVDSVSIRLLMTETSLVTLSRFEIPVIQTIVNTIKIDARKFNSPYYLLWILCEFFTNSITEHILNMDDALIEIEDEWESKNTINFDKLHMLKLNLSHMRRFLHPQLEAFQKLALAMAEHFSEKKKEKVLFHSRWRETVNFAKRDIEALTEMQERVNILHDTFQQDMHESTNRIMYLLSIVATFFLPLTFVASLFGMNLNGVPGNQNPWAFFVACCLMVAIALIQWILFKRWNWLK